MGVDRLDVICAQLADHRLSRDTPVAIFQWGTLPTQRSARGTPAMNFHAMQVAALAEPTTFRVLFGTARMPTI